jgi:hypothetical protein
LISWLALLPPGELIVAALITAAIAVISSASVASVATAVLAKAAEAELGLDGDGEEEDESAGEEGKLRECVSDCIESEGWISTNSRYRHFTFGTLYEFNE